MTRLLLCCSILCFCFAFGDRNVEEMDHVHCKVKEGCSLQKCDPMPIPWVGADTENPATREYPILCQKPEFFSTKVQNSEKETERKLEELATEISKLELRLELSEKSNNGLRRSCPQTKFIFPRAGQTDDYIRVKVPIRRITQLSVCLWVTPYSPSSTARAIISYAANQAVDNAFLLEPANNYIIIFVNGVSNQIDLGISRKTHLCVTVEPTLGRAKLYVNGRLYTSVSYSGRSPIEGGGSMLVGQEQDDFMGGLDPIQSFSGTLENLRVWYRLLGVHC